LARLRTLPRGEQRSLAAQLRFVEPSSATLRCWPEGGGRPEGLRTHARAARAAAHREPAGFRLLLDEN